MFAGTFSIDQVARVTRTEPSAAIAKLRELVDKSLIVAQHEGPSTRFLLLETLRAYAADQLEAAGEAQQLRDRHADVFADLAADIGDASRAANECESVAAGLMWMDNFREAFHWSVLNRNVERALRIPTELYDLAKWTATNEVLSWAQTATDLPGAEAHPRWSVAVACAAEAVWTRGDFNEAERLAERSLQHHGSHERPSLAWWVLGGVSLFSGDFAGAADRSRQMRAAAHASGHVVDEIIACGTIAFSQARLGDPSAATTLATALERARAHNNHAALAVVLTYSAITSHPVKHGSPMGIEPSR